MTDLASESGFVRRSASAAITLPSPSMVALGDSVTAGVGDQVLPGHQPGWAGHLAQALGSRRFLNLATVGARARELRDIQLPAAVNARPQLATILVGGNDVLRGDFDAEEVGCDVGVACDALTRVGAHVLVWLLPDPDDSLPAPRIVRSVLSRRTRHVNRAVSENVSGIRAVTVLDPCEQLDAGDRSLWHVDRMHPGPRGHRAMARMAIGALPERSWPVVAPVSAVPSARPGAARQALWLARHGTPWFVKRSRDLLPDLVRVCWRERHLSEGH